MESKVQFAFGKSNGVWKNPLLSGLRTLTADLIAALY